MKRFLRKRLPKPESITGHKYLRHLAPWLVHPRLWHMHRRSVALGIAIGLFTGLIPGPLQMLAALLIAIPLRANLLAAVFATLYTNPLTFIPLYMLAWQIGALVTGEQAGSFAPPDLTWTLAGLWDLIPQLFHWFIGLGHTLVIGLVIQGLGSALIGYFATLLIWRCAVSKMWKNRQHRHALNKP
jgi:uncharacterized protein (DUF2062 family)